MTRKEALKLVLDRFCATSDEEEAVGQAVVNGLFDAEETALTVAFIPRDIHNPTSRMQLEFVVSKATQILGISPDRVVWGDPGKAAWLKRVPL